jgi:hypothetical protein
MDMTAFCKLNAPNNIIFTSKDILMGTTQCYAMHYLLISNLLLTMKLLLMAPVDRLNVAVTEATDLTIHSACMRKHKFPTRFSGKLKLCVNTEILYYEKYFYRCFK